MNFSCINLAASSSESSCCAGSSFLDFLGFLAACFSDEAVSAFFLVVFLVSFNSSSFKFSFFTAITMVHLSHVLQINVNII